MINLKSVDGQETSDPVEMRRWAVSFYTELYAAEGSDPQCTAELLQHLPSLSEEQRDTLDSGFTLEEVVKAVERGIRQGFPLSGLLYSIAIEPLLNKLKRGLKGWSLNGEPGALAVKLSANADEVTLIIRDAVDVNTLHRGLELYAKASSAKVNWGKCEALWCGRGGEGSKDSPPRLPG